MFAPRAANAVGVPLIVVERDRLAQAWAAHNAPAEAEARKPALCFNPHWQAIRSVNRSEICRVFGVEA